MAEPEDWNDLLSKAPSSLSGLVSNRFMQSQSKSTNKALAPESQTTSSGAPMDLETSQPQIRVSSSSSSSVDTPSNPNPSPPPPPTRPRPAPQLYSDPLAWYTKGSIGKGTGMGKPLVHAVFYSPLPRAARRGLEAVITEYLQEHNLVPGWNVDTGKDGNTVVDEGSSDEDDDDDDITIEGDVVWDSGGGVTDVAGAARVAGGGSIDVDAWKVPMYERDVQEPLVANDGDEYDERDVAFMSIASCWNCGSPDHGLDRCPWPRNEGTISANRMNWMEAKAELGISSNNPKDEQRYFLEPGAVVAYSYADDERFAPGKVSDALAAAVGFDPKTQLPPWILRMRLAGFPPGYVRTDHLIRPSSSVVEEGEVSEKLDLGDDDDDDGDKKEDDDGAALQILFSEDPKVDPVHVPDDVVGIATATFPGLNADLPEGVEDPMPGWMDFARDIAVRKQELAASDPAWLEHRFSVKN